MSTDSNCRADKKEDNFATVVADREGIMSDIDDIISDDELFKQPPNEDCPICNLLLPSLASGSVYKSCCGKIICSGCESAPKYDNLGNEIIEKKCPFCRTPAPYSIEEYNERYKKRAEVDDAEAMFRLGNNYRDGKDGFPQDYNKAFELFVRAGDIGHADAYSNIGRAYFNGKGAGIDKKKSKHYFKLAAIEGNVNARHNLGNADWRAGNMNRALKHYMISAGGGQKQSVTNIRQLYMNGHATKDDYTNALRAYQKYLDEIKSKQRDKAAATSDEYKYYE